MNKQKIADEIENFINYYTSDEETAVRMFNTLKDYMEEVYESPAKNVRFVRKPDSVLVRMDNMPEFKILPSESESYQKQFLELGYTIYVS